MVERFVRDEEAAGSNPVTSTMIFKTAKYVACILCGPFCCLLPFDDALLGACRSMQRVYAQGDKPCHSRMKRTIHGKNETHRMPYGTIAARQLIIQIISRSYRQRCISRCFGWTAAHFCGMINQVWRTENEKREGHAPVSRRDIPAARPCGRWEETS